METIQLDRILVLGHSDGSIEFRFRDSLKSILSEGGLDRFCHLMQAGFRFRDVEPGQSLSSKMSNMVANIAAVCGALSPCGLATVYRTGDGKVRWKRLMYTGNDMASVQADSKFKTRALNTEIGG